jgi:hypothetical protein
MPFDVFRGIEGPFSVLRLEEQEHRLMYPTVSPEMLSGAIELICVFCTACAAIFSYVASLRF